MIAPESIADIQEAQQAMLRYIASLKPGNALTRALKYAALAAHRYTTSITHVWRYKGGALRASHRITMQEVDNKAVIFIDPASVNPRGQRPAIYGPYEHARGGEHAFYQRTENEYGPQVARIGARAYVSELPK